MKTKDVNPHGTYTVKVSNKLTTVRLTGVNPYGGWNGQNLETGRYVRVKTAARLRGPATLRPRVFETQSGDTERLNGSDGPKSMSSLFKL
jgi:hypothetical protein